MGRIFNSFFFLLFSLAAWGQQQISVLSWNIRDFGNTKDEKEIRFIAQTVCSYDVVLIQEVVAGYGGSQAVARLADALNRMGAKWDYVVSMPTDSPPYKTERYAFLWKPHRIQLSGRPSLLNALASVVDREPFLAGFRMGEERLLFLNYHACSPADFPEQEIRRLISTLESLPDQPLILAGDFNLGEAHPVFMPLLHAGFYPVLKRQPTTLSDEKGKDGRLILRYPWDNIFFNSRHLRLLKSGIIHTDGVSGDPNVAKALSDHVPVWAVFEITK